MNKCLTCFIFILYSFLLTAQTTSKVDSLENRLNHPISASEKIEIIQLFTKYLNTQKDSIKLQSFYAKGLDIAQDAKDPYLISKIYGEYSILYYNNYNIKKAIEYVNKAEDAVKKAQGKEAEDFHMDLLYRKGTYLGAQGNIEEQQEYYLALIPKGEEAKNYKVLSNVHIGLGTLYYNQKEHTNSEKYFLKALGDLEKMEAPSRSFSNVYLKLAMLKLDLGEIDKVAMYLEKAKNDVENKVVSIVSQANYYNYLGRVQRIKKQDDLALISYHKSLELARSYGNIHSITNNLIELGGIYRDQKLYKKAHPYYAEFLEITKNIEDQSLRLTALKNMGRLENELGNYSQAFQNLNEYITLSDSLREVDVTQKILQLEKQFESAQKEQKITKLQLENERKEWQIKQNFLWILACIISIIVLGALTILLYRNTRNQRLLIEQEKNIHQMELGRIEQKNQINILSSLIQGTETERQRLGRDLHDGLGGLLSGIKLKINNLNSDTSAVLQSEVKADLDEVIQEMRFISQSLLPDLLAKYGLEVALEQYCKRLSKSDIVIEFQSIHYKGLADKEKELMFYRIAQELINNAMKHANANEIFVQLQQNDQEISLTVEDDGVGWDNAEISEGSGLMNLKNRVNFLKGNLEISSKIGDGTSAYINIPV